MRHKIAEHLEHKLKELSCPTCEYICTRGFCIGWSASDKFCDSLAKDIVKIIKEEK